MQNATEVILRPVFLVLLAAIPSFGPHPFAFEGF